jgi:tight adherence protein B
MAAWLAALSLAIAIFWPPRRRPSQRLAALHAGNLGDPALSRLAVIVVAIGLGGTVAAARVPVPLLVLLGGTAFATWRVRKTMAMERAREDRAAATVEVTFALAGELRAGRTPAQALAAVATGAGPLRGALDAARLAVGVGGDAAEELARAASLPGAERLRYVAAAWSVAASAGGRVAIVLERLSESMDCDDELRRDLDSAMAGPRATMIVLAGLPLLGLALGEAVGAHPIHFLVDGPFGWALLVAAATLDGLGVIATRAIARLAMRG